MRNFWKFSGGNRHSPCVTYGKCRIFAETKTPSNMTAKEKDIAEAKQQEKELLALLLEKTGVKKQDLIDMICREFIKDNLPLVTPTERKRFTKLVF